ncbi:MAG: hypothetical protein E7016_02280 [Alphaproteobacteria bacterium]|nr:hypothetical protein [Alphaproteobacteria bacterium]
MPYETYMGTFIDENDHNLQRKFGYKYRALKGIYPDAYKLPETEVSKAIDVFYDGDADEEVTTMTDRVRNYTIAKDQEWKAKYFGETKSNLVSDSENLSSNKYYIEPHKTYITSDENLNLSKFPKLNKYGCAVQSGLQGSSLNWSDEMVGAGYTAKNMMNNTIQGINPLPYMVYDYANHRNNHRDYLEACMQQYPNLSKSTYAHGSALTQTLLAPLKYGQIANMLLPAVGKAKDFSSEQVKEVVNNIKKDMMKEVIKYNMGINLPPYIDAFLDTYIDN